MFIDTHCHLDFPEFAKDRDEVIRRSRENGIDYIINVGSCLAGSKDSLALALNYDYIYAVAGIHPYEADNISEADIADIEGLAKNNKVVAIGETGLDYYLPAGKAGRNYSKPDNQKPLFIRLIELAKSLKLPLVLHSRQAEEETAGIIKEFMPLKAVVHCFSGNEDFLKKCLDLGLFISFTCNITYKKAENLRNVVRVAPLEKIMLETDCPYLSPEGFRGQRNEPSQVRRLAQEIAKIKGISLEEVACATTENAKRFFSLK